MTLNQKYKNSGSLLSFKDWLKTQQKENKVDTYKNFTTEDKNTEITIANIPLKWIIAGIAVIIVAGVFIVPRIGSKK